MKLSISNIFINKKWGEERYKCLKEHGFDAYDYNMADTRILPYTLDGDGFDAYLRDEKRMADEAGVTIWQVHGPWQWPITDGTPEGRAERMEKMKRSIHGAAVLGAKYWVVHPIMPFGIEDLKTGEQEKTYAINLEFFGELLKTAKAEGVTICLENMPFLNFSIATPADILAIVKEINDPNFMICLDTGHANIFREWPPARVIREMGDYVKVLHVHDNNGHEDSHRLPFYGTIDWSDFSAALKESKWQGVFSLECAPSSKLPSPLFEKMYDLYADVARSIIG